jgi:hypothetical protein
MNSTKTTLAIVAVLTAATLVVGLTVAATMTTSAFAGGSKRYGQDKYMKGGQDSYKKDGHDKYVKRGQDSYKKDGHDKYVKRGQDSYKKDGNGNTNTIQVLKQNAKASGKNSIVEQNGENSICTHPSETCTSQSNQPLEVP